VTRARVAAAIAALLTALLLQATLVGPLAGLVPASLPAVLVAAVALVDGPGTGLALGFAAGLVADLSSEHPAGVLALSWLGIGLLCGVCANPLARVRRDLVLAAAVCSLAAAAAGLLLTMIGSDGATAAQVMRHLVPAALADALLAVAVVPLTRLFLHSDRLRAPAPVLLLGGQQ
jgi:cell shape-determining protein MreD